MGEFIDTNLRCEPVPDETAIRRFRQLLERYGLGSQIFAAVTVHLAEQGFDVSAGTIIDATIISAPSSLKNHDGRA